jgi:hypothetical protein
MRVQRGVAVLQRLFRVAGANACQDEEPGRDHSVEHEQNGQQGFHGRSIGFAGFAGFGRGRFGVAA